MNSCICWETSDSSFLGPVGWRTNISTTLANSELSNQCHCHSITMKMRIKMSRNTAAQIEDKNKRKREIKYDVSEGECMSPAL